MARRRESGMDIVSSVPWPFGIVLGLLAYAAVRYGLPWYFGKVSNPVMQGLGRELTTPAFAPLAWMALAACWIAALVSFIRQLLRRRLLHAQTGPASLGAMSWRQFEMLVGEAFRRQGYRVEETGGDGADGGIDLILRRDGATTLVQCKQWRTRRVSVMVVREMFGLLVHHGAAAVKIVALGDYTPDALRFAHGKPIELIHGEALFAMMRVAQTNRAQRAPDLHASADETLTTTGAPADYRPRSSRGTRTHGPLPALAFAIIASLIVFYVVTRTLTQAAPSAAAPLPTVGVIASPAAPPVSAPIAAPTQLPQHADHTQVPRTPAELREWKRSNAEAMKILEKTTPEVPRP